MKDDLFRVNRDNIKYNNNNNMAGAGILDCTKEPCIITFPELSKLDFIQHGFSTRLGGVSTEHLSTMNLSFTRGDLRENVETNFKRICHSIGIKPMDLVFSNQVHDTKIHVVTEEDRGRGIRPERQLTETDGLITNASGVPLVTFYADCVPLYFVDKEKKAIGLSHSGWRGTVNKMGLKTVQAMEKQFGSVPSDIIAVIGPSICKDCYEVSEDVAEAFQEAYTTEQIQHVLEEKPYGKYQLDLWLANQYVLLEAGIPKENITISNICTCCNSTLLFSHRASKGQRGNLAAFLSLCM